MGKINVKVSTSSEPRATSPAAAKPITKTAAAAAPATPIAPPPATSTAAPSIFDDLVGQYIRPVTLSEQGKKYIDTLTQLLLAYNAQRGLQMEVHAIPDTTEVRVILDRKTNNYIIMMFNESYTSNGMEPVVNLLPDFIRKAASFVETAAFIQGIVVMSEDYGRVEKMAAHVANCFLACEYSSKVNADVFKQMKLVPDTDIRAVREFIDRRSPHEVQSRIDWGVLLSREVRQVNEVGYSADRQYVRTPIAAIGGYTKFLRVSTYQGDKVYPICVITELVSDIPCRNILALLLPVAARCAINDNQWRRPYTTIAKDKPNLGRLLRDSAKGELLFFQNINEMSEQIIRNFFAPQLALDIPEGRAHLVGLENYFLNPGVLNNMASNFFGNVKIEGMKNADGSDMYRSWLPRPNCTVHKFWGYEGSMIYEGRKADTREVDYLSLVTQLKTTNLQIEQFLSQYPYPDTRLKNIASILGADTIYPTTRVYTIMFDPLFINDLSYLAQNVVRYTGEVSANTATDIAAIFQAMGTNTQIQGIYGNQIGITDPIHLYR